MSIVRWQPFEDLVSLREAMDRLFEESFVRPRAWLAPTVLDLPIDMYETSDELVVTVAVPGMKPEDLEITITGDTLCIKGEVKSEAKVEKASYYRQERRYGSCTRSISLPVPVQTDKVEAKLKDGILTITLPKAEEVKPKAIKIKTESK